MKKQLILAVALLGGVSAFAQPQGRYDDRRYDQNYGRAYGDTGRNGYGGQRGFDPVRSAMDTLYSLESRARVDHHEFGHMRHALHELGEFEQNRQRGRFDRGSLNAAIHDLRDLAKADQLHPGDRSRIAAHLNDLYRLRDGGNYGYGRGY